MNYALNENGKVQEETQVDFNSDAMLLQNHRHSFSIFEKSLPIPLSLSHI